MAALLLASAPEAGAQLIMPPSTVQAGLKGAVKTVETLQGVGGDQPELFVRTDYDRHGYVTRQEYPSFAEVTETTYAAPGVQSGEKRYRNGELQSVYTVELNESLEPLNASRTTVGEGVTASERYAVGRDADGNYFVTSRLEFGPESMLSPITSEVLFAEPGGRLLRLSEIRDNGTERVMKFDAEGKVSSIREVNVNSVMLTEIERNGDYERRYNSRTVTDPDSREPSEPRHLVTKTELDSHGNPLTAIHYLPDGTVSDCITYRYTYDDRGNWTRCETSGGSEGPKLFLRRLQYYE